MRTFISAFVAAALLAVSVHAGPAVVNHSMIGIEFNTGTAALWDINKSTAATSNSRPTNISDAIDIATAPSGQLFGASASSKQLFSIDPATGTATLVGGTGLPNLIEGGMAFNSSGTLFAAYEVDSGTTKNLLTLNTTTGAGTVIGPMTGSDDISGLAFSTGGTLYALDPHTNTGLGATLDTLNPATGAVLTATTLSSSLGSPLAGMAIDPDTGTLYVASSGTASLYTANPATGQLALVGSLPTLGADVSGIAFISSVPEPSSAVTACVAAGSILLRRRRRAL
jgi:DNA-binding beta-propeller fold protein YncE